MNPREETSLLCSRYEDSEFQNQMYFRKPQSLPSNPHGKVIMAHNPLAVDQFLTREPGPVYVLFFNEPNDKMIPIIGSLATKKLLLINAQELPQVAHQYGYIGHGLLLIKMYKKRVLRYFNQPFTANNLCIFFNSTKSWMQ